MGSIDEAIMSTLKVNMGYKEGEKVIIILQEWDKHLGKETKKAFEKSKDLAAKMFDIYSRNRIHVDLLVYIPPEARHGVDVTKEVYQKIGNPDIIFMPTALSLTHTAFRKSLTEKGARIASMPTFTLEMFKKNAPMNIDYKKLHEDTVEVAEKLKDSHYVRITGHETDIVVEVDSNLVFAHSGIITKKGDWGNLPGAEAFTVPVHEGNSEGYITVPVGWGGPFPLEYKATFYINNGKFVDVRGDNKSVQRYLDKYVKPLLFSKPDHNILAELGIGTNPKITQEYVKKIGWSLLTAEKIYGSAHFANGNSKAMGGKNDVEIHLDWVVPDVKIHYDLQLK